jgi:hypothetical protein
MPHPVTALVEPLRQSTALQKLTLVGDSHLSNEQIASLLTDYVATSTVLRELEICQWTKPLSPMVTDALSNALPQLAQNRQLSLEKFFLNTKDLMVEWDREPLTLQQLNVMEDDPSQRLLQSRIESKLSFRFFDERNTPSPLHACIQSGLLVSNYYVSTRVDMNISPRQLGDKMTQPMIQLLIDQLQTNTPLKGDLGFLSRLVNFYAQYNQWTQLLSETSHAASTTTTTEKTNDTSFPRSLWATILAKWTRRRPFDSWESRHRHLLCNELNMTKSLYFTTNETNQDIVDTSLLFMALCEGIQNYNIIIMTNESNNHNGSNSDEDVPNDRTTL